MRTYVAKETKSFTDGQTLADIIKGNKYKVYKEDGYFIGEFGTQIELQENEFDLYFKNQDYDNSKEYKKNYFKQNVRCINFRLFPSDQDILEHLESIKATERTAKKNGINEYIRRLIREDMARQKGE